MPESSNDKTIPVHVALRIRPLLPKEIGEGCQQCIDITPGEPQVVMGNNKAFTYDYVYGTMAKQCELYDQTVVPLLKRFYKGYNATVLAYGQTGSGKTYTMGTGFTMCSNSQDGDLQGVIPRVILDLITHMENKKKETEFLLKVSFLEIHNEEIHDLLNPTSASDKIAIRENVDGGIKIAGLTELPVSSGNEMVKALCNGSAARATGATAMNSVSSRSHAIFSIIMEQKDKAGDGDIKRAKFHLVDLAGSERCKRTNAQGERFKEGVNINKGLLALGNVISALSDEQRKSNAHVPYRDSKLTRLLQDSLGGNSNTVMIACVSPADSNYEETLNTLRYADRARQIKNKPIINRDPVSAEMARLKQQVQMLQLQLLQGQTINGALSDTVENGVGLNWHELTERVQQLEEENNKLSEELHNSVDQNTKMFEKVLMAELVRDKLIRKQEELKSCLSQHEIKLEPAFEEGESVDQEMDLATELQKKVQHFKESCVSTTTTEDHNNSKESLEHDHSYKIEDLPSSSMNSTFESQHALRQAELGRQVQELTKALTMKQELAIKMQQNEGAMNEKMVKQYETTVRELESEIGKLEKEKSELALALAAVKTSTNSEGSSKDRIRIKELETKIVDLKKKQVEAQKLQRLKQQSDSMITKLNTEIQGMKSVRVKLMRQMKEESEKFRTLKKEKEKEIMQLKQKDRKRQFEYSKLQNIHQKQQAVLKRKTEEAALANKRLQEALCKRKEAAEKRESSQNLQNKQSEGLIPKMKSWLTHEIQVLVSVSLAKKTLEELIEDRKTISQQLSELRGIIQAGEEQPPRKKKLSMDRQQESDDLQTRLKPLETELKIKSSQIAELQQQLLAADNHIASEKSKHRWNNIHTMAEAKAGLQVLLSMSVEARVEQAKIDKDVGEQKKELEELRNESAGLTKKYREQLDYLRRDYDARIITLQKEHEDKVLLILQQIPSEQEKANVERMRQNIQLKEKELTEKGQEAEALRQKLLTLTEAIDNDNESSLQNTAAVEMSQDSEMVVEDIEEKPVLVSTFKEDDGEELEEEEDDDYFKDPDWRETPRIRRSKEVFNKSKGCKCKAKCMTQACKCRKEKASCDEECGCLIGKCVNRPRDLATPIFVNSSLECEFSASDDGLSKLKTANKKKRDSNTARKALVSSNRMENPVKSTLYLAGGRENQTPSSSSHLLIKKNQTPFKSSSASSNSSDKVHKVRRKSGVLSKKPGVKDTTCRLSTPHRSLKTPGSGFTPSRVVSCQKTKSNVSKNNKTNNMENKRRKRKLHNPSSLMVVS